jgi:signal transduction histidine kinase
VAEIPPIRLVADGRLLGVAIRELVSNAIAHASSRVELRVTVVADGAQIEVEDDGKGFASADVATCAVPDRPRGLGVALGLVAEIAARHGGSLSIRSGASAAEHRLSCARLLLPLPR